METVRIIIRIKEIQLKELIK